MAKVTQEDVINFLREKVTQLTKELETSQNALNALEGSSNSIVPDKKVKKQKADSSAPKRKYTVKANGAKRGRKPKAQATVPEEAHSEE